MYSDQDLNSLYNFTTRTNIKVVKMKEVNVLMLKDVHPNLCHNKLTEIRNETMYVDTGPFV